MPEAGAALAFGLVYCTFFLDNVLLTVLVPIVPDWIRGEPMRASPLATLLNRTEVGGREGSEQLTLGLVLGAKALTQLATAPLASSLVSRAGPTLVLQVATATLLLAALMFACGGAGSAWWACAGRIMHGAASALAAVAGLSLAASAAPAHRRDDALAALLGAVALGVLVGYPFGGAADALWSRNAPFVLLGGALAADLVAQVALLDRDAFACAGNARGSGYAGVARMASRGAVCASAGAVLLTTSVMAALEPCLPAWIERHLGAHHWQLGAVFVPDSAAYLVATTVLGGRARTLGPERVAVCGVALVGCAALWVPLARSVGALAAPHVALGAGLGAADAALVPALAARYPRRVPQLAATLQSASSAAYALGPVCGSAVAALFGFPATMRTLGVANVLYAWALYRALAAHPLSQRWGADVDPDDDSACDSEDAEVTPLREYHNVSSGGRNKLLPTLMPPDEATSTIR